MPRRRAKGEGTIIKRIITRSDGSTFTRFHARITSLYDGEKQRRHDGPRRKSEAEAKRDLKAMLTELPQISRDEAKEYLAGNLCRCGSYVKILDAVMDARDRATASGASADSGRRDR
jgi:hypothetical protein